MKLICQKSNTTVDAKHYCALRLAEMSDRAAGAYTRSCAHIPTQSHTNMFV